MIPESARFLVVMPVAVRRPARVSKIRGIAVDQLRRTKRGKPTGIGGSSHAPIPPHGRTRILTAPAYRGQCRCCAKRAACASGSHHRQDASRYTCFATALSQSASGKDLPSPSNRNTPCPVSDRPDKQDTEPIPDGIRGRATPPARNAQAPNTATFKPPAGRNGYRTVQKATGSVKAAWAVADVQPLTLLAAIFVIYYGVR